MADTDLKSLAPRARKLIEQLRAENATLKRDNAKLLSNLKRQERPHAAKSPRRALHEPLVRRVQAARAAKAEASTGLAAAVARGEAARVEWVKSGELVPAKTLAELWGLTPQALGPAAERGEVFALVVKRQRFYPKEFLALDRADVAAVCDALGRLSPAEKLVFWKRPHGGLGGKTLLQSLSGRKDAAQLGRVTRLAQAWAAEAQAGDDVAAAA
jgi:hypothetical protein